VPDLLDHLRATFNPNSAVAYDRRFDEIRNAQFLVLDDLGTESATPMGQRKIVPNCQLSLCSARLPPSLQPRKQLSEIEPRLRSRMYDMRRCTHHQRFRAELSGGDMKPANEGRRARGKK